MLWLNFILGSNFIFLGFEVYNEFKSTLSYLSAPKKLYYSGTPLRGRARGQAKLSVLTGCPY